MQLDSSWRGIHLKTGCCKIIVSDEEADLAVCAEEQMDEEEGTMVLFYHNQCIFHKGWQKHSI